MRNADAPIHMRTDRQKRVSRVDACRRRTGCRMARDFGTSRRAARTKLHQFSRLKKRARMAASGPAVSSVRSQATAMSTLFGLGGLFWPESLDALCSAWRATDLVPLADENARAAFWRRAVASGLKLPGLEAG